MVALQREAWRNESLPTHFKFMIIAGVRPGHGVGAELHVPSA